MTRLLTSLTALIVLAAAAGFFLIGQKDAHAADAAAIGAAAPGFTATNVKTGEDVSLDDFEDQVVVLLFHSTSCPWYKMTENKGYDRVFVEMVNNYADQDVVFIGINSNKNESADKVKAYVEKHEINYVVVKDPNNVIADAYGAKVTPHVMVIDQEKKLRYRGGVEKRPSNPGACGDSDEQYLGPVIDALLDGSDLPVDSETQAVGCGIKRV